MGKYKIVACDLDGTLLDESGNVSRENLLAVEALYEKGVNFVPCTGRGISEIPKSLADSPYVRYFISSNGSKIHDKLTGDNRLLCLSNALLCDVLDIIFSYVAHVTVRHSGSVYVDELEESDEKLKYFNICPAHESVIRNYSTSVSDFKNFCRTLDGVESVAVFFHDDDELTACKKRVALLSELRIVESWPHNIEIFSADAGKGNALRILSATLGVDMGSVIAIGDSDNDSSMIDAAGLGLAVKNACDSLARAADAVICSNSEHCVDYVLSHYFE